ncbi:MAG: chloride channel protein [Syntrophorhabdales bacterium]|jgi:H+/Cl- antiporter ClcA
MGQSADEERDTGRAGNGDERRQDVTPNVRIRVVEESILLVSIVKWLFLAACVGVIVGLSTTVFLKTLEKSIAFTKTFPYYFVLLPAAFFASSLIVTRFAPEARGHGTEKVIEAVHKRWGKMDPWAVPVKLVATVITIAFGGSAGKEGPCAQIGAGLSSLFAGLLRFDNIDRRKLVICGISAGFATVFGTPIAGAIFGVEVLIGRPIRRYRPASWRLSYSVPPWGLTRPSRASSVFS